ncbi:MAG: glutamate 5-kinase [Myxococcota bacterium]
MSGRAAIRRARRIVVKLGTSLLAPPGGGIRARRFGAIAASVSELIDSRRQVILVSSGAVGLGVRRLGLSGPPASIPGQQAAAAVGQIDLMRRYGRAFARRDRSVSQLLLTRSGLGDRERFLNARHALEELLRMGVVPIVNENDSVATEELRFGDNDQLAAQVLNAAGGDLLILLTDTNGLYDRAPGLPGAHRVRVIEEVTRELLERAGGEGNALARGGMRAKLEAARTAARSGVSTVIADGRRTQVLREIVEGRDTGTLVLPAPAQLSSRKLWIAYSRKPRGALRLDAGATRAVLERGRSLLAAGIVAVEGRFGVGDAVTLVAPSGAEFARGLISYSASDLERIKGQRSPRIRELLGYSNGAEVIHRNDLVLL